MWTRHRAKSNSIQIMKTPTQDEIDEVLNECSDYTAEGGSKFPGMTYEQGVEAGIRWVTGDDDSNPME